MSIFQQKTKIFLFPQMFMYSRTVLPRLTLCVANVLECHAANAIVVCGAQRRWSSTGQAPVRMYGLGKAVSKKMKRTFGKKMKTKIKTLSRAEMMNPDTTDWSSVFAVAQSYNPSVIPLPIRMGRPSHNRLGDIPPSDKGNVELLKIPNFFHLTPPAIQKHCDALKVYCTKWPKNFGHRPIRITTINHLYAGPSIRHPNSRMVKLQINLKELNLGAHASRKFQLLVGDRYNPSTGDLTLVTDKCPTRQQNKDYAYYLLTALYHESLKKEAWEDEAEGMNEQEINHHMKIVKAELYDRSAVTKQQNERYKIINEKVIRYNSVGHPFIFEMRKYGLHGKLTYEEIQLAKEAWRKLPPGTDWDTFDPIYHRDSESEFKKLL